MILSLTVFESGVSWRSEIVLNTLLKPRKAPSTREVYQQNLKVNGQNADSGNRDLDNQHLF
jgi:hypothetical protein